MTKDQSISYKKQNPHSEETILKKNIPRLVMRFPLAIKKTPEYMHQVFFQQELLTLRLIIVIKLLVPRPGDVICNLSTEWDS